MRYLMPSLCAAATLVLATPAAAEELIEPGLWTTKTVFEFVDRPEIEAQMELMRQQLANMPPEMRKMMEAQMEGIGVLFEDEVAVRSCVTPEEAQFVLPEDAFEDEDCTFKDIERKGDTISGKVVCTDDEFSGEGTFLTTIRNKHHYTLVMDVNTVQQGQVKMNFDSSFTSPDCGDITD